MKKLITMILLSTLLVSCGSPKKIDGIDYQCYGFLDKDEVKDKDISYKFVSINLFPAVIFSETIVVPILIFALQSHCPVGKKVKK